MPQKALKLSNFTQTQIKHFFKNANALLRHPSLTILCCTAANPVGHILVITSRKVGNAPTRNKIRRQLKALFYEEKLYERGLDYAFIIRKEATLLKFDELKTLVLNALEQPCSSS